MDINAKTELYGLIGNPVGHSVSPLMQNTFLRDAAINGVYLAWAIEEERLSAAIEGLHSIGARGVNVTIPHKEAVMQYTVSNTEKARLCGAVNTLIRTEDGFIGDNTDGDGLLKSVELEIGWTPEGKRILLLGAGGASKGIAVSCALAGAKEIIIVNRNVVKGQRIVELIQDHCSARCMKWQELNGELYHEVDTIINATSIGMMPNHQEAPPISFEEITEEHTLIDIVYNPLVTRFLEEGRKQGATVCSGIGMLVHQGALAFERWTGVVVETEEIQKKLIERLLEKD